MATRWRVVPAFPNLIIPDIIGMVPEPGTRRLITFSRDGRIRGFVPSPDADHAAVLLDLSAQTLMQSDSGFLNLVFHPDFNRTGSPGYGSLFVWYNHHPSPEVPVPDATVSWLRLSRFFMEPGASTIDPSTETVLIEQEDRHLYHSGGGMFFHPGDGFLYLATSDEGGANDAFVSGQNIRDNLFSGVLRIDVDRRGGDISRPITRQPLRGRTDHYYIPLDNPWADEPDVLHEFYALGLRNPHRMTHDPVSGQTFIADVGQSRFEEVNRLERGANYGWPFREGRVDGPRSRPSEIRGHLTEPVLAYGRSQGVCVIGGHVYRGARWAPFLSGQYIFADLSGRILTMDPLSEGPATMQVLAYLFDSGWTVAGFGMDHDDELYFCHYRQGIIYTMEPTLEDGSEIPALLSGTGIFRDLSTLEPGDGLLPYAVSSQLWSDGADKLRWMALPKPATFHPTDPWVLPSGSVLVKHFEIQTDWPQPGDRKRLETRFLVMDAEGGAYGFTYRWNDEGTDALLLNREETLQFTVATPSGPEQRTWTFPSRQDCLVCHTPSTRFALGVNTAQLNRPPPSSSRISPHPTAPSQLTLLHELGWLEDNFSTYAPDDLPRLVDPSELSAPLNDRIRAYLEGNCAGCHRPDGVRAGLDARGHVPWLDTHLFDSAHDDLGRPGTRLIHPRSTDLSAIYQRLASRGDIRMPPLASAIPDPTALSLFREWIEGMTPATVVDPPPDSTLDHLRPNLHLLADHPTAQPSSVELWVNGQRRAFSQDLTQPIATPLDPGPNEIRVLALSPSGSLSASDPVRLLTAGSGPPVRWVDPTPDGPFHPTRQLPLAVDVATHQRVDFTANGYTVISIGTASASVRVPHLPPGTYRFHAIAHQPDGRWSASPPLSLRLANPPEVALRWLDHSSEERSLSMESLIPPTETLYHHPSVYGYWGKPPLIDQAAPDPWGRPRALRLGQGDFGGPSQSVSGLIVGTSSPLEPGTYFVRVWLRSTAGSMTVRFGLTDWGHDTPVDITETWQPFTFTTAFEPCGCYADHRLFQVYEARRDNSPWEIALPEVYRVLGKDIAIEASVPEGRVARVELIDSIATLQTSSRASTLFHQPIAFPGYYELRARVVSTDGLATVTPPLRLIAGPTPQLRLDFTDALGPALAWRVPPGQPFRVWTAALPDARPDDWSVLDLPLTLHGNPEDTFPLPMSDESRFFRMERLPMAFPYGQLP